jgi:hypothetical protein
VNYVLLAVGIAGIYPLGLLARRVPWIPVVLTYLVGILPFLGFNWLTIELVDHVYRGDSDAFQIAILDLVAAALFVALPRPKQPAPYRASRYVYLFFAVFSISAAVVPLYSLFSITTLVRGYFLLVVVSRLAENPELANSLGRGLAIGVIYSAVIALKQRYIDGMHQITGGFEHANSLGMAVNLVGPIALAVLFAGKGDKLGVATVGSTAICIVLGLSRGSLMMFAFGFGLVILGSLIRQVTRRKVYVSIGLFLAALLLLGKSADSIIDRFVTAPESSVESRDRFEAAAEAMVDDSFFGIGLNQYSHVLDYGGYADRFEMPLIDRDGLCHHIYWLTAAELGWLGLIAYLWLIAAPFWTAVRGAFRFKDDVRGDVLLGCAAGMATMHVHGLAEWIARQSSIVYIFWTVVGLTAAMSRQAEAARSVSASRSG